MKIFLAFFPRQYKTHTLSMSSNRSQVTYGSVTQLGLDTALHRGPEGYKVGGER